MNFFSRDDRNRLLGKWLVFSLSLCIWPRKPQNPKIRFCKGKMFFQIKWGAVIGWVNQLRCLWQKLMLVAVFRGQFVLTEYIQKLHKMETWYVWFLKAYWSVAGQCLLPFWPFQLLPSKTSAEVWLSPSRAREDQKWKPSLLDALSHELHLCGNQSMSNEAQTWYNRKNWKSGV